MALSAVRTGSSSLLISAAAEPAMGARGIVDWTTRAARASSSKSRAASRQIRVARRWQSSSAAYVQADHFSPAPTQAGSSESSASVLQRVAQPLPHTQPHLFPRRHGLLQGAEPIQALNGAAARPVAEDELTPGITALEYEGRRRKLMDQLPDGSIVFCFSQPIRYMSDRIFYRYRQESNLLYLTGLQEPHSALILVKDASTSKGYKTIIFLKQEHPSTEMWTGPSTSKEAAQIVFGADDAHDVEKLPSILQSVLKDCNHVYADLPRYSKASPSRRATSGKLYNFLLGKSARSDTSDDTTDGVPDLEAIDKLFKRKNVTRSLSNEVDKLRVYKSEAELKLMRQSGRIASYAMNETMAKAQPGRTEWQLQSIFQASCAMAGAQRPAYVPVVATGRNALTIHYTHNHAVCAPDDLVCMDAGCELDGYVSDITRAFPVSGHFTGPQRDLYGAVLSVLKSCTKLATQSQGYTLSGLHRRSVEMLAAELRRLGFTLPAGSLEGDIYPHALSHWLGLDLHDTKTMDRKTELRNGMCLSVEPAVYCKEGLPGVPPAFWGLGIRIEDDVALWQDENIVLNAECVREIEDVEAVCSGFWEDVPSSTAKPVSQPQT